MSEWGRGCLEGATLKGRSVGGWKRSKSERMQALPLKKEVTG